MSENLIVVGVDSESISFAVNKLAEVGGGQIVVNKKEILGFLELPILGLMSNRPLEEVIKKLDHLLDALRDLGCKLRSPFTTLGFMGIVPAGKVRISEFGLFDCELKKVLPIIVKESLIKGEPN